MTTLSPETIAELRATAHALADAARVAIMPHFRNAGLITDDKGQGRFDPVTTADRAAEAAMRAVLAIRRPDDAIMGEEQEDTPGTTGLTWVLDPIDGTRGFIAGTPTWGVLVAVQDHTGSLYGLIDQPYIGERFEGGFGHARLVGPHGDTPLASRGTRHLADATLFTTFPELGTDGERARFNTIRNRVKLVRYGMDCYAYALIALGQVDLVIEAGLHPYDVAAPIAVNEAAGGIVTDWNGGPAQHGGRILAAANRHIHAEALAFLTGLPA